MRALWRRCDDVVGQKTIGILKSFLIVLIPVFTAGQDFRQFNDYSFQPEVWQFEGAVEGGVNAKGDLTLQIPLMTVPGGNGLDFPINLTYKAGIAYHQRATWAGLGWNFDPGSITRDVQADFIRNGVTYGVDYNDDPASYEYMPDQYYVTIPGRGTMTMGRANLAGFNAVNSSNFWAPYPANGFFFEEHKPYRVDCDFADPSVFNWGALASQNHQYIRYFVVTTDDGARYVYSLPTVASFQSKIGPNNVPVQYPSAWRLVAIAGYDFDGAIEDLLHPLLTVPDGSIPSTLADKHSWILFRYRYDANELVRRYGSEQNGHILYQDHTFLKWIITPTHRANFVSYADRDDIDITNLENHSSIYYQLFRRLARIELETRDGELVSKVTLEHDYLLGAQGTTNNGKLTLKEIKFAAYDGQMTPGYIFEYPPKESDGNPAWDKFSINHYYDGFGYYNDRQLPQFGIDEDTTDARAWSLTRVIFPTGGWESYQYSNDAIDNAPFPYKVVKNYPESSDPPGTVKNELFNFDLWKGGGSCRRQGGIRVRKIIRGDGMGNTSTVNYRYGKGTVACLPPRLIPFIYADLVPGQFASYNRGDMDVHYSWIEKVMEDGDYERTYYHVSNTLMNAMVYQDYYRGNNYVFFTENSQLADGLSWGTLSATVRSHAHIRDSSSYIYETPLKFAADIVRNVGFENIRYQVRQISPLQTLVSTTSDDGSGLVIASTTASSYFGDTRQLRQQIITTDEWKLRSNYVYAHQISDYANQSWEPSLISGIRADNVLTAIVSTDRYFDDLKIAASWRVGSAQRTTYANNLTDSATPLWKPHRVYQLNDDLQNILPPSFDAWSNGSAPESRWQQQYRVESYRHGKPVIFFDANNNLLEVFYGDNDHHLSNDATANGLQHSQITAVRVDSQLTRQFDYHSRFRQTDRIIDEAGQAIRFTFDSFGRLSGAYDGEDRLLKEHDYHFSRNGSSPFSALAPNYIETTTYFDGANTSLAITYFDGLGRTLQSIVRADGTDAYQANTLDKWGRLLRQYKPYVLPQFWTTPFYDVDFEKRQEDGTLFSQETDRYTGNSYRSVLDSWISRTTHPGGEMGDNDLEFYRTRVLASDELPEIFGSSPPIIWRRESTVDENGNESAVFLDALDRKILERRYAGRRTQTESLDLYARCDKFCPQEIGNTDQEIVTLPYRQAVRISGDLFIDEYGFARFSIYEQGNPTNIFLDISTDGPVDQVIVLEGGTYVFSAYAEWNSANGNGSATVDLTIEVEEQLNSAELLSSTYYEVDGNGNVSAIYPPNWFDPPDGSESANWITSYHYNTLGQLTARTSPDAGEVRIKYDAAGNPKYVQDGRQKVQGLVTYTDYDFNHRPVETGEIKTDFDLLDPLVYHQLPENLFNPITISAYDSVPDWSVFPWNHFPAAEYPSGLNNTGGRVAAQAQMSGGAWQIVVYDYDSNGRTMEKTILSAGMPATSISYQYDRQGQLLETTSGTGGHTWSHFYDYDDRGQLMTVGTSSNGQPPVFDDASYDYNPTGTLASAAVAGYAGGFRQEVTYQYSVRDWLIGIGDMNNPGRFFAADYTYHANGNIAEAIFRNSGAIGNDAYRHTFSYDNLYRLTAAEYAASPSSQLPPESAGGWLTGNNFSLSDLSYDANGNILSLNRRNNNGDLVDQLSYGYDDQNCLETLADEVGLTADDWDAEACSFHYDPNGNMTMIKDAANGYRFLKYDTRNLPEAILEPDPSALMVRLETSAQNGAGWWGTVRYSINAGAYHTFSGRGLHVLQLNQDTGTLIESTVFDMYYDGNSAFLGEALADYLNAIPADGRLVLFGVLNSAYYSTTNQEWTESAYLAMERFGARQIRDLRHKDNYALLAISGSPHAAVEKLVPYFYHNTQSPRCVMETRAKLQEFVSYRYNAAGQRIYKHVAGVTAEHYILDNDRILGSYQDGNLQFWNIFGNGVIGHALVVGGLENPGGGEDPVEPGSVTRYYYLKDHLGSTRVIFDEDGAIKAAYDYYPFGLKMPGRAFVSGSEHNKHLFTGKERDSETGWDYFGARYYHPAIGRWMAVDPLAEKFPSLSPYNYVANNPVANFDPDGKVLDTIADIAFILYDIYDIASTVTSGEEITAAQWGALGADVAGALIPFATGGGAVIRGGAKAVNAMDTASDLAKSADTAGDLSETAAKLSKQADNASDDIGESTAEAVLSIQVTPDGVAIPGDVKYQIPQHYVENPHRTASYGVIDETGKFREKLRIDPGTAAAKKGPNYSHYHKRQKKKHNSPRKNDDDPGFQDKD